MSAVKALASAVQQCFAIYSLPADLHRKDVAFIGEIGSQLQPVLLSLQKAALQCPEEVAADTALAAATSAVLASLQQLQEAAGRCRIRHWLLRVLSARDVRLQLAAAFVSVAAALEGLSTAAAASVLADDLPRSHLSALSQLQQGVASHKLTRHEPLEALARGLLKHVTDDRTDQEQLPSMLKYVVKQAALQTHTAPAAASDAAAAGSSSSAAASSSSKAGASSSSNGAGSSRAAAEGASSSSRRAGCDGLPAGEASLTDTELLMVLEQLAASKASEEQLALYQILSILEGLQEAKRQQQREHHRKRAQRRQQQQQQPLQRVSEADDDTSTIAAVRDASTASAAAAAGTAYTAAAAAAGCSSNPAGGAEQPSACVSEVVAAMMAQLEEMLWRDPWDAVALTQLLELLLQVQPEEEEQEQEGAENGSEADSDSTAGGGNQHSRDSKTRQDQGSKQAGKKGKWWQVSAAAKAALQSRLSGSTKSSSAADSKAQKQQAARAAQQAQRAAWRERVHVLAAGAVDVLLHLTPRPYGCDSFLRPVSRSGVCAEVGHSLALPLMAHEDTVPAMAACLASGWPEVASRAAQLMTILLQSGSAIAAAGAAAAADDADVTYTKFCQRLCSSGSAAAFHTGSNNSSSQRADSIWHRIVQLLHSSTPTAAEAAAEAMAAVGSSRTMLELCSTLVATQQARALLLLLAQHQVHPGAAGAAAAALAALSDPSMRPGLHNILADSFWDEVPGAAEDLATVLLQVMQGTDTLAAARAAQLAASLAGDVLWEGRRGAWLQACKAGLKLLATRSGSTAASASRGGYSSTGGLRADTGSSVSSATSSRARASGAVLLVQLVGRWQGAGGGGRQALHATQQRVSPMLAAQVEAAAQQDLLFEALQLCVQQFRGSGSWQGLDELPQGGGGASSSDVLVNCEGAAAVRLLDALLCWLPDQAWCAVPDLYATVAPVLEHLAATQHGWLQAAARRTHELLLGVAG
uniref:Uncharacterized protein n=1 Tax=Tetradesmus obliquus TaxID=3088 RepID=A0A383WEK5_TETOB|eukprot:jgi/Sobl393_1/7057/SZX75673.1